MAMFLSDCYCCFLLKCQKKGRRVEEAMISGVVRVDLLKTLEEKKRRGGLLALIEDSASALLLRRERRALSDYGGVWGYWRRYPR